MFISMRKYRNFWNDKLNQQKFFLELSQKLGLKNINELYSVPVRTVKLNGGSGLISRYGNSIRKALESLYPGIKKEVKWDHIRKHPNYWDNKENQKLFLLKVAEHLSVKSAEDWKNVNTESILAFGGGTLLNHYGGSLDKCLSSIFPGNSIMQSNN